MLIDIQLRLAQAIKYDDLEWLSQAKKQISLQNPSYNEKMLDQRMCCKQEFKW